MANAKSRDEGGRPWDETATGRGAAVAVAFGVVLRRRRLAAGRTQEQVAEDAGLHPTAVSLLERGRRQPSLAVAIRLAEVLGATTSEIVDEVSDALRA